MSLTATAYRLGYRHLGRGRIGDLQTAALRLMLTTNAYTPAAAVDEWALTPAAAEAAGTGYTPGGAVLTGVTFDDDPGTGRSVLRCDPVLFADAGFIARWAVLYVLGGDYPSSPLLSFVDLGADVSPAGEDLLLSFPAGLLRIGPTTAGPA